MVSQLNSMLLVAINTICIYNLLLGSYYLPNIESLMWTKKRTVERAKLYIFSDGAKFFGKSPKEIFEKIYKENIWEGTESVSGIGANKIQTEKIIDEIPNVIKELQVKTIFDIPCGDFNWFKNIDLSSKIYLGGDIVKKIITQNNQNYKRNNINFIEFNLIEDVQKPMDLVFCRDCLVHFSINDIKRALINIKESNSKYLMTTTFPNDKWKL